jgi:hypothetical protein
MGWRIWQGCKIGYQAQVRLRAERGHTLRQFRGIKNHIMFSLTCRSFATKHISTVGKLSCININIFERLESDVAKVGM